MSARLSAEDAEYLRRSCEASNVPVSVSDPATILRAAELLKPTSSGERGRAA